MTTMQQFSNVAIGCNSPKHPCCGSYPLNTESINCNNDSTSDSTLHAIAHGDFTRSHNLVIGYFADIIITDITAGRRNWCLTEIWPCRQNPLYCIQDVKSLPIMPTLCSKLIYYASIMLDALACLLCLKLCQHNRCALSHALLNFHETCATLYLKHTLQDQQFSG